MPSRVIVNNPPADNANNTGFVIGAIVLLLVVVFFFLYGLPAMRSMSSPQVTVPDHMNVNVQTPGK